MAKIIYSEFESCLDCPFVRIKSKYGDANCWHYDLSMVVKAEHKPDWCRVERVIVELNKKEESNRGGK